MQNFIKKTIKGFLCSAFLLATTSNPIIVPKFPEDFVKVANAPHQLTQLSVGRNEVWGVDIYNRIYRCIIKEQKFEQVTSKSRLKHVSVGYDNWPWGIGTNNVPYQCNATKTSWKRIGITSRLIQISVGKNKTGFVWGVNATGNLYYWRSGISPWGIKKRPDNNKILFKHVSCGGDGDLWAIGKDDDSIWRWKQRYQLWNQIKKPGISPFSSTIKSADVTLKQIDVGRTTHVVGVDKHGIAYMNGPDQWYKIGNDITYISINSYGEIWLITTNGELYRNNQEKLITIRKLITEAAKAKEDAKKTLDETKLTLNKANEESAKRTEEAKTFVKNVEDAVNRAQAEFDTVEKAYQEIQEATKKLDVEAAEKSIKKAKIAIQNAQKAAKDAKYELAKVIMVEEKKS